MKYSDLIKQDYKDVNDLVNKNIKNIELFYLETLADQNKINEFILKIITIRHIQKDIKELLPSPNIKDINNYDDLKLFLETGFTIIINKEQVIAVETKIDLSRSIDTPSTEPTIFGPKDSLIENYQTNLGLIKRRVKSNNLKNIQTFIGVHTKTIVDVLYIKGIANEEIKNKLLDKLNNINVDGINDIGELKPYLIKENKNVFPGLKLTERPDVISKSLLEGKIVILMDNSPYALILPSFLADFINPISDDYTKSININFLKILRIFCFFIAIMTPAFYVAITTFNQETIPTSLLINFQNQRLDVPFPAIIECFITLITCEILRESDIRFPSSYGSAISILGGLVLGEAAVSAGIVSPIMIIVVAITFISSLIFTDLEIINALRYWRFIFLAICSIFGLYGIGLSLILFFANISSYELFGLPYFYPVAPFDKSYFKETLIKMKNNMRGRLISKNRYKGGL